MVKRLKNIVFTLTFWVLTAILVGALLGHYYPDQGVAMEPLGKQFINVVKLFINPIIFLTIVLGISSMGDLKQVGRVGGKAILYFEIVTTLALLWILPRQRPQPKLIHSRKRQRIFPG
jgi:aerobic C4-dicarboxylate transport protein